MVAIDRRSLRASRPAIPGATARSPTWSTSSPPPAWAPSSWTSTPCSFPTPAATRGGPRRRGARGGDWTGRQRRRRGPTRRPRGLPGRLPRIRELSDAEFLVIRAARAFGLGNLSADPADRVVRSVPLVAEHPDGRLLTGLALAALSGHQGFTTDVSARPGRVDAGGRRIPDHPVGGAADQLRRRAHPRVPRQLRKVSALDVLQGRVPADRLSGRTVVVGLTDRASPTAPDPGAPGELPAVLVHANAANTMLTSAWVRPGPGGRDAGLDLLPDRPGRAAAARAAAVAGPAAGRGRRLGYLGLAGLRFGGGRLMDVVRPVGAVLGRVRGRGRCCGAPPSSPAPPGAAAVRRVRAGRGGRPAPGRGPGRGGRRRRAAGRGRALLRPARLHHRWPSRWSRRQVRDVLNAYYRATTRIVFDHGGTVMQYVGDEVFAVFGAPIPGPGGRRDRPRLRPWPCSGQPPA